MPRIKLIAAALCLMSTTAVAQDRGLAGSYLAARQASFLSDYANAATYYARALNADSTNISLLDNAIMSFLGTGDVPRAAEIAASRQALSNTNQIADIVVKAAALAQDDFSQTDAEVTATDGLAPLLDGLLRGWSILGQGNMSGAVEAFETVAAIEDFASFARYHQALALATVGDFDSANAILSGDKYGPLQLSTRGILAHAQILVQLERREDALELVSQVLDNRFNAHLDDLHTRIEAGAPVPYDFVKDAKDGSAEVLFNIASVLSGRASPDVVMTYARLAQHIRPDHAPASITVAEMLEDLDQFRLATKAFDMVERDDPAYFIAEMGRADALYSDDRKDAAVEVLEALSQNFPQAPLVHAALGDLLTRVDRRTESLDAYSASLALRAPDERAAWRVYYARGIVHENLDNFPEMEADFRKALDLYPDQPEVLNYLGYSLVEQNMKLDEALGMIEKAVQERPESGYIIDSLAWVFYKLGRFEEAVEPMERAVALLPVDPIVNDHLGDVYWMVGREREAEFQWKRALSFDPEEKDADRIRRKLDVGLSVVLDEEKAQGGTETAND